MTDNYAERIEALVKERDTRQRDAEYWKRRYDGAITLERKRNTARSTRCKTCWPMKPLPP